MAMDGQRSIERLVRSATFVGREHEMARAGAALRDAAGGRPRVVLVTGEPGIGKTALADEVAAIGRADGWWVCSVQCHAADAPAYWPWAQVVRTVVDGVDGPELVAALGPGASAVARIAPEAFGGAVLPSEPPASAGDERFRVRHGVAEVIAHAARRAPALIVVEDIHEADTASLQVLPFLARHLRDLRVLVLATYRDVGGQPDRRLGELQAEMHRPVYERIDLHPLDEAAVHAWLVQIGEQKVPRRFATALHEWSGGNPLFVRELLLHLVEGDVLVHDGTRWTSRLALDAICVPGSLHHAVHDRLERLSPTCRTLLGVAAVFRSDFDVRTLAALGVVPPFEVPAAVDEAVRARLLSTAAGPPGRYRFRHGVFREVLHASLPSAERSRLHARVAEALSRRSGTLTDVHVFDRAHHLVHAASEADPAVAVDWALRAAERAFRRTGYERAAEYYGEALRLARDVPGFTDDQRYGVLVCLSEALYRAGAVGRARRAARYAVDLARSMGCPYRYGRAVLAFVGRVRGFGALTFDAEAVQLLEAALDWLPRTADELRALVQARLAEELAFATEAQDDRRSTLGQAAVDIGRRLHDPAILAAVLRSLHWASWLPRPDTDRLARADDIVALAKAARDAELALEGHLALTLGLLEVGAVAKARRALAMMTALAVSRPYYRWAAACVEACLATADDRLGDVDRLAQRAFELSADAEVETAPLFLAAQTGLLWWLQGRLPELEALLHDLAAEQPLLRTVIGCGLAAVYAEAGRRDDARREVDALAAHGFSTLPRSVPWLASVSMVAVACHEIGDAARAAELYRLMEPFAACNVVLPPVLCLGSAHQYLGLLAATAGRPDDARVHLELALAMNGRLGARHWLARTQLAYAEALLTNAGEPDGCARALAHLEQAAESATALGLTRLRERIDARVQRITGPPRAGARGVQVFKPHDGEWLAAFGGEPVALRMRVGYQLIRELLRQPGKSVSCDALTRLVTGCATDLPRPHASGPILDTRARRELRGRVREIVEQLEVARASGGDVAPAMVEEWQYIEDELRRGVASGGASRLLDDPDDKRRPGVTKAVRAAIAALAKVPALAELASHLRTSIHTGRHCRYKPTGAVPDWELE